MLHSKNRRLIGLSVEMLETTLSVVFAPFSGVRRLCGLDITQNLIVIALALNLEDHRKMTR